MEKSLKSNHKFTLKEQGIYSQIAADNIESILEYFDIEYRINNKGVILGPCPIHDGDNQSAFNLYPDNEVPCLWRCNTLVCHKRYKENIFGLIHALLQKRNSAATYQDAIDWLLSFLGISKISLDKDEQEKYTINSMYTKCFGTKKKNSISNKMWLRKDIQKQLIIPADYYIKRKYSPQTISKYDIGLHKKVGRIYIPIYNNTYTHAIAFTSRSPYEKCSKCNKYHNPAISCPSISNKQYEKWVNSPEGFAKNQYLFNYWFAHPYIKSSKTAIIVEGPGDVLRLEDNNIHNCVATFGTSLCIDQRVLLEKLGVTHIICLYDNDEAGQKAKESFRIENSRNFYLYFPSFNSKDVGDASQEDIQQIKDFISTIK